MSTIEFGPHNIFIKQPNFALLVILFKVFPWWLKDLNIHIIVSTHFQCLSSNLYSETFEHIQTIFDIFVRLKIITHCILFTRVSNTFSLLFLQRGESRPRQRKEARPRGWRGCVWTQEAGEETQRQGSSLSGGRSRQHGDQEGWRLLHNCMVHCLQTVSKEWWDDSS